MTALPSSSETAPLTSIPLKTVNVVVRLNICVNAELSGANDFKDPRVWQLLCSQVKTDDSVDDYGEIDVAAEKFLNDDVIEDAINNFIAENAWEFKQSIIDSVDDGATDRNDSGSSDEPTN